VIRVFVLAEIRLYRQGLARVLKRRQDIEVVGLAAGWDEASKALGRLQPDVVLLDMTSPESFDAVRRTRVTSPASRIVALGVRDREDEVLACAQAGVSGYVTRDDSLETLIAAIESVARGELLTTPRMAAVLFERFGAMSAATGSADAERLTPREREIAELVRDGFSNKAIAQRLQIEIPTVKNHVHNILEKLKVHRRGEAAALLRADIDPVRISTQD
jgi:two-component system, NarL family, nitrate/nitrite response regulator NarL